MNAYNIAEVMKHNKPNDLWIIIHSKVYDVTSFVDSHPGGKKVILKIAGIDCSKEFNQFHNKEVLEKVASKYLIGTVEGSAVEKEEEGLQGLEEGDTFGDMVPFGDPYWYSDWPSPYYDETHRKVRAIVRKFVEKEVTPFCHEWDETKELPRSLFLKAGEAGILQVMAGAMDPKYHVSPFIGGVPIEKWNNFHGFIVMDELCRCGSGGALWGLIGGLGIGLPPVIRFGSDYLKDKVVKNCISGRKNICLAITEPSAGSDVANLVTEAKKSSCGKFYILNGEKKWITNGVFADYFTVACRTGKAGMGGVSLILVEKSFPGITVKQMKCSGVWASGTTFISFDDVKVPVENIIGKENEGFKYIMFNFNHERMGICIQACRFARVCYEDAMKYSHKRKTFGVRLIEHPVIRNKLAHMARKIESTHAWMENLIYQSIMMPEDLQMLKLGGPIALLKAQCTQTMEFCAREASQIFGGLSYTRGGQAERVERLYREVRAYAIPGGSEEIMLELGIRQAVKVAQFMGAKL